MSFVITTVIIVVFSSIVLGGIKKFKINNVSLTAKQKIIFPFITLKLFMIHFNRFIFYFLKNRELSNEHLRFMTIDFPIAYRYLIEIAKTTDLEINTINWVNIYKVVTQKTFTSRVSKKL